MVKTCDFCGYRWHTRKRFPKSCPRCKRRFDYFLRKLKEPVIRRI